MRISKKNALRIRIGIIAAKTEAELERAFAPDGTLTDEVFAYGQQLRRATAAIIQNAVHGDELAERAYWKTRFALLDKESEQIRADLNTSIRRLKEG